VYLESQGYRIVERNYRCQGGEIDLIGYDGAVLCFVEVRARSGVEHGHPLETIDGRKIRRVVRAARNYLGTLTGRWPEMRFDALGIVLAEPPHYELIRAAFEAT
jgi:putative endonuclease